MFECMIFYGPIVPEINYSILLYSTSGWHDGIPHSWMCIGVNRPAFGGTVPHLHQMSRVPQNETDVPHL